MPLLGTSASQNTKSFLTVPVDFLVVAGGGGGAGANASGKNGGIGTASYSSWGSATSSGQNVSGTRYYAGGGGGVPDGIGGSGGGGGYSTNGTVNTGGGAGGNANIGGSGIVIIRYLKSAVA
jgi:hypothetical protein